MQAFAKTSSWILALTLIAGSAFAQRPLEQVSLEELRGQALEPSPERLPMSLRDEPIYLLVELGDAPAAQVYAEKLREGFTKSHAGVAAKTQINRLQGAQAQLRTALTSSAIGAQELYSLQRVANGIVVRVDPRQVRQIFEIPGVQSVRPVNLLETSNSTSVDFIGTPEAWDSLGLTGAGVSIGIIDTGIDYLHTNHGGSGSPADYAANDTTILDGFFPNARVIGGFDFAGDNYNPGSNDPAEFLPAPDPDPMDCNGHGSHVAGSAAGSGVNADGTTYTDQYDASTPFDSLKIGPGTAPEADLYALRVFGCAGATTLTSLAIEWATDPNGDGDLSDHLDIVNLSLGSGRGSGIDASTIAAENASSIGMIVVAAAGNAGNRPYIVGAPSVAPRAIAVAGTEDNGLSSPYVQVASPDSVAGNYPAGIAGFGAPLTLAGISGEAVAALDAENVMSTATDGCTAITNPDEVAGKIAIIDRGQCSFLEKVKNAQDAGAIAALIVNNQGDFVINMGGESTVITIPSAMVGQSTGNAIRQAATSETVNLTLGFVSEPERADRRYGSSSRGPARTADAPLLKPDVAAPAVGITSTRVGSGSESLTISGTSMATPHVAGIMALLRELHPDWSVEELKALVMNTATADVFEGANQAPPRHSPMRVGTGRVKPADAANSDVIAYNADGSGTVNITFETVEVVGTASEEKTLRVVNKGDSDASFDLAYAPTSDASGVDITVGQESITVPAGGSVDVTVRLDADATAMQHDLDPTLSTQNAVGLPQFWLKEEAGHILLSGDSGDLRVAVYSQARAAGDMSSARRFVFGGQRELMQVGDPVANTVVPNAFDVLGLVTLSELQYMSENDPGTFGYTDAADIAYVGASTDYRSAVEEGLSLDESTVFFSIATHGDWSSPAEIEFNVFVDADRDGETDYIVFNGNFGTLTGGGSDQAWVSAILDVADNAIFLGGFLNGVASSATDTVTFNTNVMALPMPGSFVNGPFDYSVVSLSREGGTVEITPTLTYDPTSPGFDFSDRANRSGFCPCVGPTLWTDIPGQTPFGFDQRQSRRLGSLGILMLHHQNATPERRKEIVFHGRRLDVGDVKMVSDDVRGAFRYFVLRVDEDHEGPLTIGTALGGGEIDLFVRKGAPPTQDAYDYRSDNNGVVEAIRLDDPEPGTYYVGIQAITSSYVTFVFVD